MILLKTMKENKVWVLIIAIVLGIVVFPLLLNWLLLRDAIMPVVGDSVTWLTFWPVYLSAIASFGMIYFTYRSLLQNKKQLEEMRHQREEEERARLVFSVIVYKTAFMLKISNIGKRNVYNAVVNFNEDFLKLLPEQRFQEGYRQLGKSFFVEAGSSRYLLIGWCEKINEAWKNKNVVIKLKGSYNDVYTIDEEIDMKMFLNKTFIVVQGDLETTIDYIKEGLVVQNKSYMPVQRSLDQIAKSIVKVETSLEKIAEKLEEPIEEMLDTEIKNQVESQQSEKNTVCEKDSGEEKETGDQ